MMSLYQKYPGSQIGKAIQFKPKLIHWTSVLGWSIWMSLEPCFSHQKGTVGKITHNSTIIGVLKRPRSTMSPK